MEKETCKNKTRKCGKTLIVIFAAVAAAAVIVAGAAYLYLHSMLGRIRRPGDVPTGGETTNVEELIGNLPEDEPTETTVPPTTEETVPTEPDYGTTGKIVNIMAVGQDSREGENHKLSDTIILFTLNKETKTLTLSSFMRDMYVKLPNMWGHKCGHNRINTAYALGYAWKGDLGAMQMLDQLILEQFGVEVDYNIEIGLEAFETIIDKLGGVDITLTADEAKYLTEIPESYRNYADCTEGLNHLNGMAAQFYVRMRHANAADNDFNRTARQRELINQVVEKCRGMNALELHGLLTELLPYVLTDMTDADVLTCAAELLPYVKDLTIESQQIPAPGTYSGKVIEIYDIPSAVLIPDIQKNRKILMEICEEG